MHRPEEAPDVLPPLANLILALLWIVLLGGRWIAVPLLSAAGILTQEQVAAWDSGLLLRCYLLLFAITMVVVILRAVRGAQAAFAARTSPGETGSASSEMPERTRMRQGEAGSADTSARVSSASRAPKRRAERRD